MVGSVPRYTEDYGFEKSWTSDELVQRTSFVQRTADIRSSTEYGVLTNRSRVGVRLKVPLRPTFVEQTFGSLMVTIRQPLWAFDTGYDYFRLPNIASRSVRHSVALRALGMEGI